MPTKSYKSKKSSSRKNKNNKNTKRKSKSFKNHRGGYAYKPKPTMSSPTITKFTRPTMGSGRPTPTMMEHMMGGSPASSLVMEATTEPPLTNDYFPRTSDNLANSSCQSGGGAASDMVMENLTDHAETFSYPEKFNVKGNINSLNTYELTGGKSSKRKSCKRKNCKLKSCRMSKKHGSSNNKSQNKKYSNGKQHIMKGGYGSAWIASQYSQGNINGASMNGNAADFSASQGTPRDMLMNPPTLGLAGSGYPMSSLEGANVQSVGAPLV